jgi:hypothetical protein
MVIDTTVYSRYKLQEQAETEGESSATPPSLKAESEGRLILSLLFIYLDISVEQQYEPIPPLHRQPPDSPLHSSSMAFRSLTLNILGENGILDG